ncbi:hypothetical protein J3Q64DRAFT_1759656 [Phycomyces blakesleeanus]|uniref:F-box domain-containing protein n=2 Tax=Phycomyces blakesleeanus TaxID=4837 RepID=A0A162TE34_PHYB8|nr:hypothetical protein PHYBLDRAFT_173774 [Phycomyces blakesleeanus NRRL 1555(-)]OAD67862.1 hypothetical protein PHYBLDRAFT_173774 [Phycomyces blakesleeanus NRRL 1555(-)]|eukprot:XP_018285902.1 hypothetical protein PHYBLDRAFT_173774 [Phycomyces blakesleeanus NRRL 1555(-)]
MDRLPYPLLFDIMHYLDPSSLLTMAQTNKFMSIPALQSLWKKPTLSSHHMLSLFTSSLNASSTSVRPYYLWVTELTVSFSINTTYALLPDTSYVILPDTFYASLRLIHLNRLSLCRVQINMHPQPAVIDAIRHQMTLLDSLDLFDCSPSTPTVFLMKAIQTSLPLTNLRVSECYLSDFHVQHFAAYCPELQNVQLRKTGYLSDSSITALASNCPKLEALAITLPSNIVQSNTITLVAIKSLAEHCPRLRQFICPGQTRISGPQTQAFIEQHCPLLRDYDFSLTF